MSSTQTRCLHAATAACLVVMLVSASVLIGWLVDSTVLKHIHRGFPPMMPNTAVALFVLAVGCLLARPPESRAGRLTHASGLAVCALGLLTLAQYVAGVDLDIDNVLLPQTAVSGPHPGRPAPSTALVFVLLGMGLWLLDRPIRNRDWHQLPVALGACLAFATLTGYFYEIPIFYGLPSLLPHIGMAVHTSISLVLLSFALFLIRPDRGIISLLSASTTAGKIMRRLAGVFLTLPLLLGLLVRTLRELEIDDPALEVGLVVFLGAGSLLLMAWQTARRLHREELERQVAEAKVQALEEMYRRLLSSAPDGIIVVGKGGSIEFVNERACSDFGYLPQELLGQSIELLVPERGRASHRSQREEYTHHPKMRSMTGARSLYGRRKDGSEFPVDISLSPSAANGKTQVTAIIRDMTERKALETKLRNQAGALARSNEELEQFAYVASHDLQEPLRTVALYLQLLEKRYSSELDATAREYIGFARNGALRMRALINDLLSYSRIGARAEPRRPISSETALADSLANLERAITESGARISHGSLPTILIDERELAQLFQNLVGNAIKYRGERPPDVRVSAERQGSEWVFSVSDNGLGIPADARVKIFRMFQRLSSDDRGTGIGLALCKRIVEKYGGRIWVESEPGQGSTFLFTLPTEALAPTALPLELLSPTMGGSP